MPDAPVYLNYGTTINYGGVEIANVSTESIKQSALMDSTNSDQIGVQVQMSITGILHKWNLNKDATPIRLGLYAGNPDGSKGGENIEQFRPLLEKLNMPMRRFIYRINDTVVWDVAPIKSDRAIDEFGKETYDLDGDEKRTWDDAVYRPALMNTPKSACSILRVITDSACWVRMEIEFIYNPCDSFEVAEEDLQDEDAKSKSPISDDYDQVASIRWWCADDINVDSWLTTRTWSGVLQLKSRSVSPHIFRYLVFPVLPKQGWKRAGIRFSESEDGLSLRFDIVDQEIISCPPFPASSWKGSVVVNAPFAGAGIKTVDISLELQAPKEIRKDHLVFLMLRVMDTKIQWYNFASNGTMFVQGIRISEVLEENVVSGELSVSVVLSGEPDSSNTHKEKIGFPDLITKIFGNDMTDPDKRQKDEKPTPLYNARVPNTYIEDYHAKRPSYWLPGNASLAQIVIPLIQTPCRNNEYFPPFENEVPLIVKTNSQSASEVEQTPDYKSSDDVPSNVNIMANRDYSVSPTSKEDAAAVKVETKSPYLIYKLASRYITDKGISAFPLFGSVSARKSEYPEVIVARLHRPITKRVFRFEASRINRWPVTPTDRSWTDPETKITHICDRFELEAHNVEASADGRRYRYTVTGTVTYVLSRTPSVGEKIFVGSVPHITGMFEDDDIPNNSVVYMDGEKKDGGEFKPDGTTSTTSPTPPPTDNPPEPPVRPQPGLPVPR